MKRSLGFLVGIICALVGANVSYAKVVSLKYVDDALAGKQAAGDYALKSELPTVPTKVSELENDSAFITDAALATYATTEAMNAALAGKQAAGDYALKSELPTVPTKVSELENDSAFITDAALATYATTEAMNAALAGKQAAGDYALKSELPTVPTKVSELENDSAFITDAALATYATTEAMNAALAGKAEASALSEHVANKENPHSVTKAQVGLGNVQDVDQTNANNLTSGTVSYARLPVGSAANTVAAGDDARFNTIPTSQPSGTPPAGHVFIWFN